ncbi:hypothetical protein PC114_g17644 [Phytophthora cactorum]|nr:hypothetical protein PC114_g17644 [Phytophthora cactorum]
MTKLLVRVHTVVGPVEPINVVGVLVVGVDDGEFIVCSVLLTSLGIDVDHQLEQLAARDEDESGGDPIELEVDEMPVKLNGSKPSGDVDIFSAMERMIDCVVENRFPLEHVEILRWGSSNKITGTRLRECLKLMVESRPTGEEVSRSDGPATDYGQQGKEHAD